jgi:hypothetical protein
MVNCTAEELWSTEVVGLTKSTLDAVDPPPEELELLLEEPEPLLDELELLPEGLPPELEPLLEELEPELELLLEELEPELELLLEELELLLEELEPPLEEPAAAIDAEAGVAPAVGLTEPPHAERARAKTLAAMTRRETDGQRARIIAVPLRCRFQYSVLRCDVRFIKEIDDSGSRRTLPATPLSE